MHLGIDPSVVFHDAGYRGNSDAIRVALAEGGAFGVPVLQWLGLAASRDAIARGAPPYPAMRAWTNEETEAATDARRA